MNGNPEQYGFHVTPEIQKEYKKIVTDEILDKKNIKFSWYEIQDYIKAYTPDVIINNVNYNWILDLNIDRKRSLIVKYYKLFKDILRKVQKHIYHTN